MGSSYSVDYALNSQYNVGIQNSKQPNILNNKNLDKDEDKDKDKDKDKDEDKK